VVLVFWPERFLIFFTPPPPPPRFGIGVYLRRFMLLLTSETVLCTIKIRIFFHRSVSVDLWPDEKNEEKPV
jgi:hypothetical protein